MIYFGILKSIILLFLNSSLSLILLAKVIAFDIFFLGSLINVPFLILISHLLD